MVNIYLCENETHAPGGKWFLEFKIMEKNGVPEYVCPYCGNNNSKKIKVADICGERVKEILNSHEPIFPQLRWKELKDIL